VAWPHAPTRSASELQIEPELGALALPPESADSDPMSVHGFRQALAAVLLDRATPPAKFAGTRQFARSTRWRTAVQYAGSIVVLAVVSACASHTPDAVPQADASISPAPRRSRVG
jgi:hypothetical protein